MTVASCSSPKGGMSSARNETCAPDDQQSSALALAPLLLLGKATLCLYVVVALLLSASRSSDPEPRESDNPVGGWSCARGWSRDPVGSGRATVCGGVSALGRVR
jgi:hypothetical protein